MAPFFATITDAFEKVILSRVKNTNLLNEYYNRSDKRIGYKRQAVTLEKKEIKDWKLAIMSFTDPDNPRRGLLMRFYESLKLDLHLGSCLDQRILPIQCAKFKLINEKGEEDTEAHKLLEKPWFLELIRLIVKSTFEGTTLIELFEINEKGEIKEIAEIPQSNFLAHKGIVITEEMDDFGTSYKEGIYKNYYIQIGADASIGLLNQLAMIILAKKLGLGSWMSYIEKFGIPPIFITTDRMDRSRIDELFEMLTNFKSSFFAVLQGSEKIETQTNAAVDGYQSFKALHEVCDNAISKRLLGGTGTTDEKSFVGSAEVHERQLQMRNKVDKLLFKFYFNEEIKPRLVALSSVYAPLAKLTFDFDDKETLTLKETIELIKSLSQFYEFDIDELVKITGLPITAVKSAMGITTPEPNPQKKKPDARLRNYSGLQLAPFSKDAYFNYLQNASIKTLTDELAAKIYEGSLKAIDLDADLVNEYYYQLQTESKKGWGDEFLTNKQARLQRENLIHFSCAKTHNLLNEFENIKKTAKTHDEYKEQCRKAVNKHNRYLEVEKKYTARLASSNRDYSQFIKEKDVYPFLKFKTKEDSSVTPEHAIYNNVIKKVEDWTIRPPLAFWCRCTLEQTLEKPDKKTPAIEKDSSLAQSDDSVFGDGHSYFNTTDDKKENRQIKNFKERVKQQTSYLKHSKQIKISPFADVREMDDNLSTAKIIITSLPNVIKEIEIRAHVENVDSNPEYNINGHLADAKRIKKYNGINNGVSKANKQGCEYVIFDLNKHFPPNINLDFKAIENILSYKSRLKEARKMRGYIFVWGKKAVYISAKTAKKGNFIKQIKKIKP